MAAAGGAIYASCTPSNVIEHLYEERHKVVLAARSDFIATFAAHVSHELKSPLTSIQGAAELLYDEIADPMARMDEDARRRFLGNILADTKHMTAIVNRLRELARAEAPPIDGRTTVAAVLGHLRIAFPDLALLAHGDLDRTLRISDDNLRIVLGHLADNAVRHGATHVEIEAKDTGQTVRLTVRDDGEGISPNNRARVFDNFFTTRREEGGTGMGLSIVRAMLAAHGGSIELVDGSAGTTFVTTLPADRKAGPR